MVAVYTPSLRDRNEVLKQLRECRTYAFDRVMDRGAQELAAAMAENDQLRAALKEIVEIDHYPDATIARKALGETDFAVNGE